MSDIGNLDKCPAVYVEYRCALEPKHLAIARDELNENEHTRGPALEQMRQFIAKHPQITRCRTDPLFLLMFLRNRKFNVVAACESLEKYLTYRVVAKDFFYVKDPLDCDHLVKQGIFIPLDPDEEGRKVFYLRSGHYDPDSVLPEDVTRLGLLALEVYQEVEHYQVMGIVLLVDLKEMSLSHVANWTLTKLSIVTRAMNEVTFRWKQIHVFNIPKYTATFIELAMRLISPKLRNRVV
ncbi:clavesin-1-like, partial [Uranotaenia lowii]|uniref:clavesin-1-like n=1 Tax=Uranotaenia lowii TaxID=190385 RepID=UPI0024784435